MGIFGSKSLASEVDSIDVDYDKPKTNIPLKQKKFKNNSSKYGIDRAIILVRTLQKHNVSSKVIAGIMKQTLESVEIHFEDIIEDASRKESEIKVESGQKDKQIEGLKQKFEILRQEKVELQQELDDTVSVRKFLLQAIGSEKPGSDSSNTNSTSTAEKTDAAEGTPAVAS